MNIHIPPGTRDLIGSDVLLKRKLQRDILKVFENYAYQEVMTPAIEYYQTYHNAFSNLEDGSMYKFFDENGDILTLRMDMTVPIARLAATKFSPSSFPLRLCYSANVYKVKKSFAGKRHEVMDCGIELIGVDESGDLEVICCALDTLKVLNLKDAFLEIGSAALFKKACEAAGLSENQEHILSDLIDSKSMIELEKFLEEEVKSARAQAFFMALPFLAGKENCLEEARRLCFSDEMIHEVDRLFQLSYCLKMLSLDKNVIFDLGKIPHQNYYTGLIFEGYVPGIAHSILSGGRYDQLLSAFGLDLPACGFSIKLDYLLDYYKPATRRATEIHYPSHKMVDALHTARKLHEKGPVILIKDEENDEVFVIEYFE